MLESEDQVETIHCIKSLACHVSLQVMDARVFSTFGRKHYTVRMKIEHYAPQVLESLCVFALSHIQIDPFPLQSVDQVVEQVVDESCFYVNVTAKQAWINIWNSLFDELSKIVWSSSWIQIDETGFQARLIWSQATYRSRQDVYDRIHLLLAIDSIQDLSLL